jgi:hypothetical protein
MGETAFFQTPRIEPRRRVPKLPAVYTAGKRRKAELGGYDRKAGPGDRRVDHGVQNRKVETTENAPA